MDKAEDFRNLENELRGQPNGRGNRLNKDLISNPRSSTFRRLSRYQTVPSPGPQRVTIHYEKGRAPTLEMRFSALDMPTPAVLAESIKSRPNSEWLSVGVPSPNESLASVWNSISVSRKSSVGGPAIPQRSRIPRDVVSSTTADRHPYNAFTYRESFLSAESPASDSFEVVQDKFPGLPHVAGRSNIEQKPNIDEDDYPDIPVSRQSDFSPAHKSGNDFGSTVNTILPSNSLSNKRKRALPLPTTPIYTLYDDQNIAQREPQWVGSRAEEERDAYKPGHEVSYDVRGGPIEASSPYTQGSFTFVLASRRRSEVGTPDTDVQSPFVYDDRALATGMSQEFAASATGDSVRSAEWLPAPSNRAGEQATTASDIEEYRTGVRVTKGVSQAVSEAPTERDDFGNRVTSTDSLQIPWLINDVVPARGVRAKSELVNIKDVKIIGAAPKRTTPRPEQHEFERKSLTLEHMEILDGVSLKRSEEDPTTRRDSETLPLGYAI